MNNEMKAFICIITMLTITPIVAVTGLVTFDPNNWGGEPTLLNIIGMAFFGLITVQVWVTYIPTLIFTPIILKKLSKNSVFHEMHISKFTTISILCGSMVGIFILLPCILMAATDSLKLTANWAWAGALSGAVTYTILSLMYRLTDSDNY